jgi:hypothetical protein
MKTLMESLNAFFDAFFTEQATQIALGCMLVVWIVFMLWALIRRLEVSTDRPCVRHRHGNPSGRKPRT